MPEIRVMFPSPSFRYRAAAAAVRLLARMVDHHRSRATFLPDRLLRFSGATFLVAGVVLHPQAPAQTTPCIDARKDSLYYACRGPENGHLKISHADFLPLSGPMPESDADLSAEIWSTWDEKYFYLYAEIRDDSVLANKPSRPANDCLELKFDPDPGRKSWGGIMNVRLSALDSADAEAPEGVDNLYADPYAAGVLPPEASAAGNFARRRVPEGYALEMRLAWEWLAVGGKAVRPREGARLGVSITVHDNDGVSPSPSMRDGSIQWSAGMADEVWLVPQLLGTMELERDHRVRFIRTNSIDPAAAPGVTYFSRIRYSSQKRALCELENWRYHPGDDSAWAAAVYDDTSWEIVWPGLAPPRMPRQGWDGIGWFRIHVLVDSSLTGSPLGLRMLQLGASEVYLDGKLLYTFGKVAQSRSEEEREFALEPHQLIFNGKNPHTLAVRFSNHNTGLLFNMPGQTAGFELLLGEDFEKHVAAYAATVKSLSTYQGLFVFIPALLMLLHLLMFAFYPRGKEHLYFALAMFCWVLLAFNDLSGLTVRSVDLRLLMVTMSGLEVPGALIFGLMTFYIVFLGRFPRLFLFFLTAGISLGIWLVLSPANKTAGLVTYIVLGLSALEMARVAWTAGAETRRRRWVIGLGFSVLMIAVMYQILMDRLALPWPFESRIVYMWGLLVLSITVSVDLSQTFARTNRELSAQLAQVRELSAKAIAQERRATEELLARREIEIDNARKTKELEEARRIQLSMLPRVLPEVPGLDIAAYTQPASEVGGDYYDFHQEEDGTLTIAIGDATGHGMKAGTMVATVKGMFSTQRDGIKMRSFFEQCSSTIKSMHLGNLYMALTLATLRAGKLTVSAAGMPPVLVYRATTGHVESITCRGMPLGAAVGFPYVKEESLLEPGDAVLLMSDGLAELFNESDEIFDYPRVCQALALAGAHSAETIIDSLKSEAERWRGTRPQNDDITFVVVKSVDTQQGGKRPAVAEAAGSPSLPGADLGITRQIVHIVCPDQGPGRWPSG